MRIEIEPAAGQRYKGELFLDGELVEMVFDKRPGCCARSLMNQILFKYGHPEGKITLEIDGW